MSIYAQVPLGEICTVDPKLNSLDYPRDMVVSFVPMCAVDGRTGTISSCKERALGDVSKDYKVFEDGDILFAKLKSCMENGKVALAKNLINGIGYGSTDFFILRPSARVLGEYVYYFIRQPWFREKVRRRSTGTSQQRVSRSVIENTLIPLPPLEEQSRVVGVLNRVTMIERSLAQIQERLREFISALFVRMFGDPLDNPMRWPVKPLGRICTIVGGGTPRRSNTAYFGGAILWATPSDVTASNGLWLRRTSETITETGLKESSARLVPAGTVLLTSRATVGFTAIASAPMATNQGFANLTCGDLLLPEYLAICLHLAKQRIIQLAQGTTFKEIKKSTLREMTIPLPEITLQQRFADMTKTAYGIANMVEATDSLARVLSNSLAFRFFEIDVSPEK